MLYPLKGLLALAGAALALTGVAQARAQVVADDVDCSRCVDTGDIASGAVTSSKLANDAVTKNKIQNGAVKSRHIGPGQVVTGKLAEGAVTAAKLAPDAVFGRILVVRADPADKVGNCDDLLATLAGITDNDAANRYLISLEAGTYDCGTLPVQMKPFVDIQGAGRNATVITGSRSDEFVDGVLRGAGNAELRRLSVSNVVSNEIDAVAIYNDQGGFRITDVRADSVASGVEGSFAIVIDGPSASAVLTNVAASATPANSISAGVTVFDGARVDLIYVVSTAGPAVDTSNGLLTGDGATVTLRGSTMTGVSEGIFSIFAGDTINVVASQLGGAIAAAGFGTFRCVGATFGTTFFPLPANCNVF